MISWKRFFAFWVMIALAWDGLLTADAFIHTFRVFDIDVGWIGVGMGCILFLLDAWLWFSKSAKRKGLLRQSNWSYRIAKELNKQRNKKS